MTKDKKGKTAKDKQFEEYNAAFNSEEDRIGYSVTMILAVFVGFYYMCNLRKFTELWYHPQNPAWRNFLNFGNVLLTSMVAGYILAKSISFGIRFTRRNKNKKA